MSATRFRWVLAAVLAIAAVLGGCAVQAPPATTAFSRVRLNDVKDIDRGGWSSRKNAPSAST